MIVYKIKDNKIVGISTKDTNYILKENEYSSNTWFEKPLLNGTEVVESITQSEKDEKIAKEAKEVIIENLLADKVVIWRRFTNDGLKEVALVLKNDGKTETIIL